MRTASVRDLRLSFPRVLAWLQAGEEVQITRRNQVVGRLVPENQKRKSKRKRPDFAARLAKRFPDGGLKGKTYADLLFEERDRY